MAGRKENLKALFTNTRSRVIIIFTAIVLIIAVVIGVIRFTSFTTSERAGARVTGAPTGIRSIPGSPDPTAQYAHLVETRNIQQAEEAQRRGSSAIPTIIRTQAFGEGVQPVGPQQGEGGVGFSTLALADSAGEQQRLWLQALRENNCSRSSVQQVISEGAKLSDVRGACSCVQLKDNGYPLTDLGPVCSCKDLKAAGFNARQMKEAGFTAGRLRECGFDACSLRSAGFTAQEMKDGGFTDGELKGAGFSDSEIARASGLPDGISVSDVQKAGCDVAALTRLRSAGVSAGAIRRINGCSATQLKAAGFTAQELKNSGFSAADLRNAGFSPADLRQAGFSARELLNAGFTSSDLKGAGYTPEEINVAENELPPGMTVQSIKEAGCDIGALRRERLAGVSAKLIRQQAGCSARALKAAGFSDEELARAGFTPEQIRAATPLVDTATIRAAGCDPIRLRILAAQGVAAKRIRDLNGCTAAALRAAGYDAKALTDAGFTPQQLLAAGFTPAEVQTAQAAVGDNAIRNAGCDPARLRELVAQGVSAERIRNLNGCTAAALRAAGYDAKALAEAGFTPQQLLAAGFSPAEVQATQPIDDNTIRAAGCDPNKLRVLSAQGVSATRIRDLNGCNANALRAAGYSAQELLAAGYTPQELLTAGFTPAEVQAALPPDLNAIRAAGCDPAKLRTLLSQAVSARLIRETNGCTAETLKAAGYDAKALSDAGFTPQELLAAGFTPQELNRAGLNPTAILAAGRTAGCSVESLTAARAMGVSAATIKQTLGCTAEAMKRAGYTAAELRNAGYTAAELKNAGFTAEQLKAAGFSARDLRAAGFTPQQLRNAGFSAAELKDAGFTAAELKNAGFSAADLKAAGFNATDLKNAGFSAEELRRAGFSAKDLKDAGFTAAQLRNAGFSAKEMKDAGFTATELSNAGFSAPELQAAGFSAQESSVAGLPGVELPPGSSSSVTAIPSIARPRGEAATGELSETRQLQEILKRQQTQMADQRSQQKLQQRASAMQGAASALLQGWHAVSVQTFVGGAEKEEKAALPGGRRDALGLPIHGGGGSGMAVTTEEGLGAGFGGAAKPAIIKTGDVVFAVLDTSINSDEPGPILATIVSGRLKGAKLIGSFNLPSNADKMVISFNTMSVPGSPKSVSINAFAIDPNTARTALASSANHHYLMRYGSLFAATFLEGFGNAFQSAGTTITIGGTGTVQQTTIQSGIGRSILENAVIGLATLGKNWGQVAQQQFNRPTTVEVCAGTGVGILFTQDVKSI